jgi:bifunctional DNA-binding transcriptional regulator/antitoxin component of YhaV-PrlF toxin-antitoxin module
MTTIIAKATSKGQITLPASWRKNFKTNQFVLSFDQDSINIKPIDIDQLAKDTNDKIVFNAIRDNEGVGISAEELQKVLIKING